MYRTESVWTESIQEILFSDLLTLLIHKSLLHRFLIQREQPRVRGVALSLTAAWVTWQFPETALCLVGFLLSLSSIFLFRLPCCFDWCWSLRGDRLAYPMSSQGGAGGVLKFSSNSRFRLLNPNILQAANFWWEKVWVGVLGVLAQWDQTSLRCWDHSTAGTLLQVEDTAKRLPEKLLAYTKERGGVPAVWNQVEKRFHLEELVLKQRWTTCWNQLHGKSFQSQATSSLLHHLVPFN